MSLRFASLGSGSKGNCTVVDDGETCLLIDLGFTLKECIRRLDRLDLSPADIDGVLVTHEHADHIHGVAAFARKFGTPIYLSHGTYQPKKMGQIPSLNRINCHAAFDIGTFLVEPIAVPHDAREPCQYVLRSNDRSIGVLTDLGHITPHVSESYSACDALLLECNHDLVMLENGPYPYPLKQRVAGDYGHLNNEQAAALLAEVDLNRLQTLVISHISEKNNHPDLAVAAVTPHLSGWAGALIVANQHEGLAWVNIK